LASRDLRHVSVLAQFLSLEFLCEKLSKLLIHVLKVHIEGLKVDIGFTWLNFILKVGEKELDKVEELVTLRGF
jgi:hypothetical protein